MPRRAAPRRTSPPRQVCFSPDGRWVLSASFDKSIKLWDGAKGTFVATFRGHVGPVYQVGASQRAGPAFRLRMEGCASRLAYCGRAMGERAPRAPLHRQSPGISRRGSPPSCLSRHPAPTLAAQVAWSSDSRLFVSGSKDSTLKACGRGGRSHQTPLPFSCFDAASVHAHINTPPVCHLRLATRAHNHACLDNRLYLSVPAHMTRPVPPPCASR
jgi:hypothetical protein